MVVCREIQLAGNEFVLTQLCLVQVIGFIEVTTTVLMVGIEKTEKEVIVQIVMTLGDYVTASFGLEVVEVAW